MPALLRAQDRPDLPATVQVGLNIGSWPSQPDITLSVKEIVFSE